MDFRLTDHFVNRAFTILSSEITSDINKRIDIAKLQLQIRSYQLHKDFRTLSHVENFHPYKRCDINEYREGSTLIGFKKLLSNVPNTMSVEVEHSEGYLLSVIICTAFPRRFEVCKQLEQEYEYDVKKFLAWIVMVHTTLDIKFFHYYL